MTFDEIVAAADVLKAQLEEKLAQYQEVSDMPLPETLQEALDARWELSVNVVEFAALTAYLGDDQRKDRQRLIRLGDAIDLIVEFEDHLISASTSGIFRVIVNKFNKRLTMLAAARPAAALVWDLIQTAWEELHWNNIWDTVKKLLWAAATFIVAYGVIFAKITASSAVTTRYGRGLLEVLRSRNDVERKMRDKALPQSNGKRTRKMKVTRL
jgi:hypothetical protein